MTKNEKKVLLVVNILLFILIIYPIFKGGLIGGYDPGFHMARIRTLASNISAGHFPNPIGFEYLDNFGYGVGFFYGNLFVYPFAILNALGLGIYKTYIVLIATFVIANIASINYATQKLFHNSWATIFSAPIYLTSYYFISVIYLRAAIGELMAFTLIPLIFLSLYKIINGEHNYWKLFGISFSCLLVTHVLSFVLLVGTTVFICLMNIRSIVKIKGVFLSLLKGSVLFLGLSSVFLFSFIQQYLAQPFVNTAILPNGTYSILQDSVFLQQKIYNPKMSLTLSGTRLLILIAFVVIYYLIKNKIFHFKGKLIPQFLIIVVLYSAFIFSPTLVAYAIKYCHPLSVMQAITRLCVVILPLLTMLVANSFGEIIESFKKFKLGITAAILVIISILTIIFPIQNNLNFVADRKGPINTLSVSMGEYEPQAYARYNTDMGVNVDSDFLEKTQNVHITKNNHPEAVVDVPKTHMGNKIMLPRLYYKGYQVKIDYNNHTKTVPAETVNGLVAMTLPKDFTSGTLTVTYHMTGIAKLGWIISGLTLVILLATTFIDIPKIRKKDRTEIVRP